MLPKLNSPFKVSCFLVIVILSSCSNKIVVTQKPMSTGDTKITFNSSTYCTLRAIDNVSSRDWYKGSSTVNSSVGVLKIEFDFFEGEDHENYYPQSGSYSFTIRPAGYRMQRAHSFQSRIGLDKRNLVFINYTQETSDAFANLFILEAKVVGGTGVFKHATGTIASRVQINRISRSALVNHTVSIDLNK